MRTAPHKGQRTDCISAVVERSERHALSATDESENGKCRSVTLSGLLAAGAARWAREMGSGHV